MDLLRGIKRERAVDLIVRLSGEDFRLERMYTSQPNISLGGLPVGKNWWLNVSNYMSKDYDESMANEQGRLTFVESPWNTLSLYAATDADMLTKFTHIGTTTGGVTQTRQINSNIYAERRVIRASVTGIEDTDDPKNYATFALVRPGQGEQLFRGLFPLTFASWFGDGSNWPGSETPATALAWERGLLLQERDIYGHTKTYVWSHEVGTTRLDKIVCRTPADSSSLGAIEAEIRFEWNGPNGNLSRVKVMRPTGESVSTQALIETQRVEYTYYGSGHDPSVGSTGDLVQVHTYDNLFIDSNPISESNSRVKVWQYRYHRLQIFNPLSDELEPYECLECTVLPPEYIGGGLSAGADHQLKMIIEPDAIEYTASRRNIQLMDTQSVLSRASELLTMHTDDTVFTEDATTQTVRDLASKFIQYEIGSSSQHRVVLQEFGGSCGCGGGSGGAAGKRLVYTYAPIDDLAGDGDWVTTVRIKEFIIPAGGGEWTEHLDRYYDITYFGKASGLSFSVSGIPYLQTEAVVERVPDGNDGFMDGRAWVTHYEYADGDTVAAGVQPVVSKVFTPSATGSYVPADLEADPVVAPTWTAATGRGRVEVYTYSDTFMVDSVSVITPGGTPVPEVETEYFASGDPDGLPYLPKRVRHWRDGVVAEESRFSYGFHPNPPDEVLGLTESVAWVGVTRSAESVSENGPGGTIEYTTFELFDRFGLNTHSVDALGVRTSRDFRRGAIPGGFHLFGHGALQRQTLNSGAFTTPESALYAGAVESDGTTHPDAPIEDTLDTLYGHDGDNTANGGALTTRYTHDIHGWPIQATSPGGVTSTVRRSKEIEPFERDTIPLYVETVFPHGYTEGSDLRFSGPVRKRWITAGGNIVRESDYDLAGLTSYNPLTLDPVLGSTSAFGLTPIPEVARRVSTIPVSGLPIRRSVWSDISAGSADIVEDYVYDGLGRLALHVDANLNAERVSYDIFDRQIVIERGTKESETLSALAAGAGNLLPVRSMIYDEYFDGTSWAEITGNGLLTTVIDHPTASSVDDRYTHYVYDSEERRIAVVKPESPHMAFQLDRQGRTVREGHFAGSPSVFRAAAATDIDDLFEGVKADRVRLTETFYGQRGLVYRTREAVEPGEDPEDTGFVWLEHNRWFDALGRVIAEWSPASPGVKTEYDGLGRPRAMYYTDRGGDSAPGVSGSFADAGSLDGDTVLEQVEYAYVVDALGEGDHLGQRALVISRQRLHDATATGALTSSTSVTSYAGFGYDGADRLALQINFGSNDASFASGTMAPTATGPGGVFVLADASSDSIYSQSEYDNRGRVIATVASGNGATSGDTRTAFFYDDANRRVGVIENHDGTASIERDTSGTPVEWGWILDSAGSDADENRSTIFAYDPAGNMTHLVAARHDLGSAEYQVTRYFYTTRTSYTALQGPTGFTAPNHINSNSALFLVQYPMAVDSSDSTDFVQYRVNRLGETIGMQDQNGTVHIYEMDPLGRLTNDRVALGSGVANYADRMEMLYDAAGRLERARTYLGSNVENAVEFEYTGLGQVRVVRQNPVGDIGSLAMDATAEVEYTYETEGVDRGSSPAPSNYSRRVDLLYPSIPSGASAPAWNGRTNARYEYSAGLNSRISRPSAINTIRGAASHRVNYDFIGMGMLAVKEHEGVHVRLDRFKDPLTGVATSGEYPAYDHLGRVKGQLWIWTDANGDWNAQGLEHNPPTMSNPGPARPAIVDLRYAYDAASNVTSRLDRRASHHTDPHSNRMDGVDERYRYDGLNRLQGADRGRQKTVWEWSATDPRGQEWDLDLLGNWSASITNTNLTTSTDQHELYNSNDTVDTRKHNAANEILDPASPGSGWGRQLVVNTGSPTQYRYEYDQNGNMTARIHIGTGDKWGYRYDAWNRLVHVYVHPNGGSVNDRVFYRYNPLHWRVRRTSIDVFNPAVFELDSRFYYDADWRLIEERTHIVDELAGPGDPPEPAVWQADEITQWVWGMEYIDELLSFMRDTKDGEGETPADGRFDDAGVKVYHAAHDRLYSVVALLDSVGEIVERVRYNAYGLARQSYPGDFNADGVNGGFGEINFYLAHFGSTLGNTSSNYNVHVDANGDGVVDSADFALYTGMPTPSPSGWVSSREHRSVVGYAGYLHDAAAGPDGGMYLARHRWMDPAMGRWVSRDPASYWGGFNLSEYTLSSPTTLVDPGGLSPLANPDCASYSTSFHLAGGVQTPGGMGVVPRATANAKIVFERRQCKTKCCINGQSNMSLREELSIYSQFQIDVGVTIGARLGGDVRVPVLGKISASAYAGLDLAGGLQGEGRASHERAGPCGGALPDEASATFCARGIFGLHGRFGVMATVRVRRWNYEVGVEGTASAGAFGSVCFVCDASGCRIDTARTTFEIERRIILQGRACVGFGCATARWNLEF